MRRSAVPSSVARGDSSFHGKELGGLGGERLIPLYRFVNCTVYKAIEALAAFSSVDLQFIFVAFFYKDF